MLDLIELALDLAGIIVELYPCRSRCAGLTIALVSFVLAALRFWWKRRESGDPRQ